MWKKLIFTTFYKIIMKRTLFIIVTILLVGQMGLRAQDQADMDKLTAYKIAFFTRKLDLTPSEAEKFWPVYNEYSSKKSKIQLDRLSMMRYIKMNEAIISNEEITGTSDKLIQTYIDESNLTIVFATEIKKILPAAKIIKFYQAEVQYKQQLLQELKERRQGNGALRRP